jgi:hypothetical protein
MNIVYQEVRTHFFLRGGEQSGNKANNRGEHKAQEQKDKKHKTKLTKQSTTTK